MFRNASGLLENTELDIGGNSTELVILLHGLGSRLNDCHSATREALPNADIWAPTYPAAKLSAVDPSKVARRINSDIEDLFKQRKARDSQPRAYEKIYLVGFSGGGAILRRAYLIGKGIDNDKKDYTTMPKEWPELVDRIVLLAGINRGISDDRPDEMNILKYLAIRTGFSLLRIFEILRLPPGRFVSSFRRGSSFISNLRLDWIDASRHGKVPVLIQLLGDRDDIVAEGDNIDVLSDSKAVYIKVPDSSHETITQCSQATGASRKRREKLISALADDQPRGDGLSHQIQPEQMKAYEEITDFVFVLHGIRDRGEWTSKVKLALTKAGEKNHRIVESSNESYGYFPMIRFLLFMARQTNVRWFIDQYVEAFARYPNAKISFVGHSNGTYILAAALKKYSSLKFRNVYFAASVVPTNFPWGAYIDSGQVKAIRSDTATADWVVGFFPAFYEFLGGLFFDGKSDLGSAGFNGFVGSKVMTSHRFKGDHGAAIQEINHKSLASFIVRDHDKEETPPSEAPPLEALSDKKNGFVELLSKNCWFVWGFILVLLWLIGAKLVVPLLISYGISPQAGGAVYVLFVLLLMYCL